MADVKERLEQSCMGCARGEALDSKPMAFHLSEVDGLPTHPCRNWSIPPELEALRAANAALRQRAEAAEAETKRLQASLTTEHALYLEMREYAEGWQAEAKRLREIASSLDTWAMFNEAWDAGWKAREEFALTRYFTPRIMSSDALHGRLIAALSATPAPERPSATERSERIIREAAELLVAPAACESMGAACPECSRRIEQAQTVLVSAAQQNHVVTGEGF